MQSLAHIYIYIILISKKECLICTDIQYNIYTYPHVLYVYNTFWDYFEFLIIRGCVDPSICPSKCIYVQHSSHCSKANILVRKDVFYFRTFWKCSFFLTWWADMYSKGHCFGLQFYANFFFLLSFLILMLPSPLPPSPPAYMCCTCM